MKFCGNTIAFVHHAFADGGAKAGLFNNAQNFFRMSHGFHRQRAGRAAFYQFRNSKLRGSANRFPRVRRFHRPNPFLEPIDQ